jgi:hypothetical protein
MVAAVRLRPTTVEAVATRVVVTPLGAVAATPVVAATPLEAGAAAVTPAVTVNID